MLIVLERMIARARRRDGAVVQFWQAAKVEVAVAQEIWVVRAFGTETQIELLNPSYDVACAKFYNLANLDPITPWEGLEYFSPDFREPTSEALIQEGFRKIKLPAGYSGQAVEMEIAEVDRGVVRPTGERILQASIRSAPERLTRYEIQSILGLATIGNPEGYIIQEWVGDGVRILFARKVVGGKAWQNERHYKPLP